MGLPLPESGTCEPMEFTGERMVPEHANPIIFWEHVYRYRFATSYTRGRHVLDIACGEGYDSAALLRAGAASVVGVDISEATCRHARKKYGVDARQGDAEHIPLAPHSVDVIVSFETIEHVPSPELFLRECVRVLRPGGVMLVSTPNKEIYTYGGTEAANPYHCSEMTRREFTDLLLRHFRSQTLFSQILQSATRRSHRYFALNQTPVNPVRGYGRVVRALRRRLCPHVAELTAEYQKDPAEAILRRDRPFAGLVNPYAVRVSLPVTAEKPYYFLSVASL